MFYEFYFVFEVYLGVVVLLMIVFCLWIVDNCYVGSFC